MSIVICIQILKVMDLLISHLGLSIERNKKGYRIDLFLISKQLINKVVDCYPLQDVEGSCNVPLLLDIDIITITK